MGAWIHGRAARRASYKLLFLSLVLLLAGTPVLELVGVSGRGIFSALFVLAFVSCLAAALLHARWLFLLLLALLAVEAASLLVPPGSRPFAEGLRLGVLLLLQGLMLAILLADVARARRVTTDTILGACSVYLLLGLLFAQVFLLLEQVDPGSFSELASGPGGAADVEAHRGALTYFSFVTLTTLGYGDVAPVRVPARSLSVLEAALGQLYVAIVIARLVAVQIAGRPAPGAPEDRGGRPVDEQR